jgi:arsenite-transporting ATPase
VSGLSALEIDPQDAAQQYRARIVDPIKGLLPDDVVNSISEQLSGACTTEIAAFDEFTGLLTDASLLTRFDHIIFDTAPTGHTIRLLQLPGAWSSFIESNPDGASCLGPMAGLEKQREQYAHAVEALSDPERTRLVLVARLQKSTLQEVARTHDELSAIGLKNQYLVINGVLPASEAERDALAAAIWQREQEALANLPAGLSDLPTDNLYLQPLNMVGVSALKGLLNEHAEITSLPEQSPQNKPENMSLSVLVDDIARSEHGLIMLMGKGGWAKPQWLRLSPSVWRIRVLMCISPPQILLHISVQRSMAASKICRSAESTLTMKLNAIVSMFLRRKAGIWMRLGNGCSKRIYVLLAQKRLRCSRRFHA